MRWDIIPWQGVNTVRYGMTDEQVAQALGIQKTREADYRDNVKKSIYGIDRVQFIFRSGNLDGIEFPVPETTQLFLGDISLFGSDPFEVVDYFIKTDPELYEDLGTYTSGTHGLRLGDFTVSEEERRMTVYVFSRRSWDEFWAIRVSKMKKVSRVG